MSLVTNFSSLPTDVEQTKSNSLFIWLDILGFAEAVDDEGKYKELSELLTKFQNLFNESDEYSTEIISDGIVLYVKQPSSKNLEVLFKNIAQKQFEFILQNQYFIRGGIALGTKYSNDDSKNNLYISNGLARAVKLESSIIDWPIIGIDEKNIVDLKNLFRSINTFETFGLKQTYNKNGQTIYFIDFVKENPEYLQVLYAKIEEFKEKKYQAIRNKYIWLLRYYIHKFNNTSLATSLEGIVL